VGGCNELGAPLLAGPPPEMLVSPAGGTLGGPLLPPPGVLACPGVPATPPGV